MKSHPGKCGECQTTLPSKHALRRHKAGAHGLWLDCPLCHYRTPEGETFQMNRHLNRVQPSYGKVKRERSALPASPPDKEERPVTPGAFSTDDESSCSHHFTPPKKRQRTMSASSSSSSCSSVSFSALPEPEVEVDFPELPVDQQEIQHRAVTVSPVKLIP